MKRTTIYLALALVVLLAGMGFKGALVSVPPVRAAQTEGQFDANRAVSRLARILGDQRPHTVDTPDNDAVRERLLAELRAIGLRPWVTNDFVCGSAKDSRAVRCARVRNVLATIGPAAGRHVLVTSHYDSTPVGPGASDDGIGVSVMLETAALLTRRDLKRPVTFLFDEGEEAGLLGAHAFLRYNPLADRVGALVNFESRGVTGPATMFETNSPNGAALGHFARSVRHASANSLATDMAKLIPNSTDVEILKARGWTTLNFAIIGNETRYHSPGDTLAALDRRSVQHMGDQGLAAIADLASGRPVAARHEKIYMDVLGGKLVVLPAVVGLAGVAILLLGAAVLAWPRKALGRPLLAVAAALAGAAALSFLAQHLIGLVRPGEFWRAHPDATAFAVSASALLASAGAYAWLAGTFTRARLRPAFWLFFLIFGGAVSLVAPGGSIYFLAPPLVALAGMATGSKSVERAAAIGAALLLFATWAPLLALAEILLDFDAAWIFAPVAALIMLPVLIELTPLLKQVPRKTALAALAGVAIAAWAVTLLLPAYSENRKQKFGIEYVWDQQDSKARWMIVNDGAPLPARIAAAGPWKKEVKVPWSTRRRWAAPAPGSLAPPSVEKVSEAASPQGRRVTLIVRASGYDGVTLRAPPEAALRLARVNGSARVFGKGRKADDPYQLRCEGRSCDAMRVELLIGSQRPVETTIIGYRNGLPAAARPLTAARPALAAPQYTPDMRVAIGRFAL